MATTAEQIENLRAIIAEDSPIAAAYWTAILQAENLAAKNNAGSTLFKLTKRWITALGDLMKEHDTKQNTFVELPPHLLYISWVLERARDTIPRPVFAQIGFRDFDFHGWNLERLAHDHPLRFVPPAPLDSTAQPPSDSGGPPPSAPTAPPPSAPTAPLPSAPTAPPPLAPTPPPPSAPTNPPPSASTLPPPVISTHAAVASTPARASDPTPATGSASTPPPPTSSTHATPSITTSAAQSAALPAPPPPTASVSVSTSAAASTSASPSAPATATARNLDSDPSRATKASSLETSTLPPSDRTKPSGEKPSSKVVTPSHSGNKSSGSRKDATAAETTPAPTAVGAPVPAETSSATTPPTSTTTAQRISPKPKPVPTSAAAPAAKPAPSGEKRGTTANVSSRTPPPSSNPPADSQPTAGAESAKRDRTDTADNSPGPARKRSKQKITSAEFVPPQWEETDSDNNAGDEKNSFTKLIRFFELTQVDPLSKKVSRGVGVLPSPPASPEYSTACHRCMDTSRKCTGWPGWACDQCRLGKQKCSFQQLDWEKKKSFLEWTAKGGNLGPGADEEKKGKSSKKEEKRAEVKQKKGKAKAIEGEQDSQASKPRKPRLEEIPIRRSRTPAPVQATGNAAPEPEGLMDVDPQPTSGTSKVSPSASQPPAIPPAGPLSADHVQWIMATMARLEAKIDGFKEDIKRQVVTELLGRQQTVQMSAQPMQDYSDFPQQQQQQQQPLLPPAFPHSQQTELPFAPQEILDWGNALYSQPGLLPRQSQVYRMDDNSWNMQNTWPGDASGGHIHRG